MRGYEGLATAVAKVDDEQTVSAFSGQFWLPGDSQRTVPGRLVLSPGKVVVEMQGELTPSLRTVKTTKLPDGTVMTDSVPAKDGPKNAFVVHGALNESPHPITLVDCFTVFRRGQVFGNVADEQHLHAQYLVRGAHISGMDERFNGFSVRFQHIEPWAALGGFTAARDEDGQLSLTLTRRELEPVSLKSGGKLVVKSRAQFPLPTESGGHIHRRVWFEITEIEQSWEEIRRLITTPLSSLLTLMVGQECAPIEYEVETQAGDWVHVLSGSQPSDDVAVKQREVMTGLADITLQGVATWLDKAEEIGPLPPVVANVVGLSNIRIETQLLELTTVAEGLHSRLFPDDRRMEASAALHIRQKVESAIAGEDQRHRQIVGSLLAYLEEPGYVARLERLANEVVQAVPGITGKTKRWANLVSECRNKFAHRKANFLHGNDLDRYYCVIVSLKWVLTGVLLLQTGIQPSLLASRVEADPSFVHFRNQLPSLLPNIYSASEDN